MATPSGTRLGAAQSSAAKAKAGSRLQAALSGKRPVKPVTVHVHGIPHPAVMAVVGSERSLDLEGLANAAMDRRGLVQIELNQGKYELQLAYLTLAEAVLDSEENPVPFGSASEWGLLAPEVIGDLWQQYGELRAAQDPSTIELTRDDVAGIREALEKKSDRLLRWFGARRLSRFLLTLVDPHANSSTGKSSPGDSSPTT